jgi:hypothetical protein
MKMDLRVLASRICDVLWTAAEETNWDRDLAVAWVEKIVLNDPELSSAVIDLTHEDQKAVIESVLLELAERRAPRAQ